MLHRFHDLRGREVYGPDGLLGTLADLYFDDHVWQVRYAVVDTGGWFRRRHVLVATDALERPGEDRHRINCSLTREQFQQSPDVSERPTISHDEESRYREFFGWPRYWGGFTSASTFGLTPERVAFAELQAEKQGQMAGARRSRLRSMHDVRGYDIAASDGPIGHVDDFIVDDESWIIRDLVVDTHTLLPGKCVLIEPEAIEAVEWIEGDVVVKLSQGDIRSRPEYKPERAT